MRRRLKSPLFPLFQVHVGRWILNTLQILCFSETIHHLYICRWNWIVVRGVSCLLGGDFVQTPPHTSIKTSRQVTANLNIDLESIAQWAAKWLVGFNKKTDAFLISRRLCRLNHRTLFFNHVPIPEVQSHKHLGIYFSDEYDWQVYLNYIQEKAWSRLHLLRSMKFTIERKSLQIIYFSFIRPL